MSCILKQLREKHISTEVSKCVWSPKMDLIAIANIQGQVILQRLSWQQVWVLNPPKEDVLITAIAWRPDGKILTLGYTSGVLLLVNVEDSGVILRRDFETAVSCVSWPKYVGAAENVNNKETSNGTLKDCWSDYMISLPQLGKSYNDSSSQSRPDVWQEPHLLQEQSELNILCVGILPALVHLYAFGLLHVATIDLSRHHPPASKISCVAFSPALDSINVVVESDSVHCISIKSGVLSRRSKQLRFLAQKYGQIHSLSVYLTETMALIEEAWDSALIEMDAKLAEYSASFCQGTISAEFLELLVFGHTNPEFEVFLTTKLTESNLKKLRQSFDLCYSIMQRLVVKHIQPAAVSLIFLLSQVQGMAKRTELYGELGVCEDHVSRAIKVVGSFLLKVSEFLEAIESSMKDFSVFVRWVSNVHLRLNRELVPADLSKISQQDTLSLLAFLNDSLEQVVTDSGGQKSAHFRLERTGQYLKKEELKALPRLVQTPFSKLLNENSALASHSAIFTHNPKSSLMMELDNLVSSLDQISRKPESRISGLLEFGSAIPLGPINEVSPPVVSQIPLYNGNVGISVIFSANCSSNILIVECCSRESDRIKAGLFYMDGTNGPPRDPMTFIDAQFYSGDTLSLLLSDPGSPRNAVFSHLSLPEVCAELGPVGLVRGHASVADSRIPRLNLCLFPEGLVVRRLEAGPASFFAVSGPRKVAAVVGENRRRIRVYEVASDDEDEDDDDLNDSKNESGLTEASNANLSF